MRPGVIGCVIITCTLLSLHTIETNSEKDYFRKLLTSSAANTTSRIQRSFHCGNQTRICRINDEKELRRLYFLLSEFHERFTTSNVTLLLRSIKYLYEKWMSCNESVSWPVTIPPGIITTSFIFVIFQLLTTRTEQ